MRCKFIFFLIFFINFFVQIQSRSESLRPLKARMPPLDQSLKAKISDGEIFSESEVTSGTFQEKNWQELKFKIAGLHAKSCSYALRKLSLYENYSQFIDFVKLSEYDEKNELINFKLSHLLLPYDMLLTFRLPRIRMPGIYFFSFDIGILQGLRGEIHVIEEKDRCIFFTKANWKGSHTGFPNLIFEIFSETLSKLSMEKLFRISSTLSVH